MDTNYAIYDDPITYSSTTQNLKVGTINYVSTDGTDGQLLATDGNNHLEFVTISVPITPGLSTNDAIVRFDGTTGNKFKNSTAIIDDSGNTTINGNLTVGT